MNKKQIVLFAGALLGAVAGHADDRPNFLVSLTAFGKIPELIAPTCGAELSTTIPSFRWKLDVPVPAAAMPEFKIQIARDPDFSQVVDEDQMAAVIQWYVPSQKLAAGQYWWRVGHEKDWSEPRSFRVQPAERVFRVKAGSSWAEIKQVFAQAAGHTPARIVFDRAEYRLEPVKGDSVFIKFSSANDLAVDGNGALVTFTKPVGLMRLEDCRRVMIENLSLDIDPPGYTAGKVLSVAEDSVEIEILPGHVLPDSDPVFMEDRKGMLSDPSEGYAIKRNSPLVIMHDGLESAGDRTFRVRIKNQRALQFFEPGDIYVMSPRRTGLGADYAVNVLGGEDVVFHNLTIWSAANVCFGTYYSDRHAMLGVELKRKDGRVLSANNGGNNHHNNRTGPWIENCLFENVGDDTYHVNGLSMGIEEQLAPDRLIFDIRQPFDLYCFQTQLDIRPQDRLLFFNRAAGRLLAESLVESVKTDGGKLVVTMDRPVNGIHPGPIRNDKNAYYAKLAEEQTTHVYNASRMCNQTVFRNNTVRNGRRIGVLVKGAGGIVENNLFENMGGGGVEFWNAPFEGLAAENYVVRNNRIIDCGRLNRRHAGIWAILFNTGNDQLHRNLLIEKNEISGFSGPGISLSDVNGVVVRNNKIENGSEPMLLQNCSDVKKK
jgi:hypothetical protein